MDEHEVEERLRSGLEARAGETDVTAPVAARVRDEVRRRRRTRWGTGAAAAAVVLVAGGVAVAMRGGERTDEPPLADEPTTTDRGAAGDEWRTEYWADVAVDVPADWGYGGAPFPARPDAVACYPEAMVGPDGDRLDGPGLGWVGRPIGVTDVCAGYPWIEHSPLEEPDAPYVWLGAAVVPGTVTYANGFVQETVVVNDSTVTVGAREAGLRKQILATARGGETCMANLAQRPRATPGPTREGRGDLLSAEVCAYRRDGTADYWLSYAQVLDPADAEAAFAGAEDAEPSGTDCDDDPSEFVVLRATYEDPAGEEELERVAVFEMGCGGTADLGNGDVRVMTPAAVAPWSRNGIPAVVVGPDGGKGAMIDSFIGMQG